MKYCKNCGDKIQDSQNVCPHCGTVQNQSPVIDNGGFAWGLLGFCVPVAGLILYLVWKDERPLTAKAAGTGALISVGISFVIYIIYFVIIAAAVGMGGY